MLRPSEDPTSPDKRSHAITRAISWEYYDCTTEFGNGNYKNCLDLAMAVVKTVGVTHLLVQVIIISLQRLGREEEATQLGSSIQKRRDFDAWEKTLIRLSLGQLNPDDVCSMAIGNEQRCQAHYYAACRLITSGHVAAGESHLDTCLATGSEDLDEYYLANLPRRK
jgi:hypothetical protein